MSSSALFLSFACAARFSSFETANMRSKSAYLKCIGALLLYLLCVEASLYPSKLDVSGSVVVEQLLKLATFSDHPNPSVTRIVFTPNDMKARAQAPSSCCAPAAVRHLS